MSLLVSVIVPVYKTEKYLDKCIESIVTQTYKNLEIILVEDGSPDSCPAICDEWAEKDNRIKVIHKENGGVSSARNIALDISSGDYIIFVDSDDYIDSDMIDIMVRKATEFSADIVSVGFMYENCEAQINNFDDSQKIYKNNEIIYNFIKDDIRPEVWAKMIKKSVIGNIRFSPDFGYAEDLLFNYYIFKKCKMFVSIPDKKYHYVQNSCNSSTTDYITHARANSYKVFEEVLSDCKNNRELYCAAIKRFTVSVFAVLSRVMLVKEFSDRYYNEIADTILKYKKDILGNDEIAAKYKISVKAMQISKSVFKKLFVMISR